jgi:hypothetical protein
MLPVEDNRQTTWDEMSNRTTHLAKAKVKRKSLLLKEKGLMWSRVKKWKRLFKNIFVVT